LSEVKSWRWGAHIFLFSSAGIHGQAFPCGM